MKISRWTYSVALSAGMASVSFGQITGIVIVKGKIPEMPEIKDIKLIPECAASHPALLFREKIVAGAKGELANAVISIKTTDGKKLGQPPATPAELSQKGCVYSPHVVAVCIGQSLVVRNADPFLHTVHPLAEDNQLKPAINRGQVMMGPFTDAEVIKMRCDVHMWMLGWIVVLDNPYFAVTSAQEKKIGTFSIDTKGLPDGEYTLDLWHESFKPQEVKVKMVKGKAEANFTLDMEKDAK